MPTIESIVVRTASIELSGLLSRPLQPQPRGLIVALHGGGLSAGYWDCPPRPELSLLHLGAELGYGVLALDRPGYGASQNHDPSRLDLESQTELLFDAIDAWCATARFDGPAFLIGHSVGGILALRMAAHARGGRLGGVDVLGVPFRYPAEAAGEAIQSLAAEGGRVPVVTKDTRRWLLFGPPETYDEDVFEYDGRCSMPMPLAEYRDGLAAPALWPRLLPEIRVPVQYTLTEFEKMQAGGWDTLNEVRTLLSNSQRASVHLQKGSGHNTSHHHVARAYHLRALAFFEECIALQAPRWR